jgi:21S rRNA (GM2251-2'-O)-methyltransferase
MDYLYGYTSVLTALQAGKRVIHKLYMRDERPTSTSHVSLSKTIVGIARDHNIEIEPLDAMQLNLLCDNRPHQGLILQCDPLDPMRITEITQVTREGYYAVMPPTELLKMSLVGGRPPLWLVLDNIQDPQNMGNLIRSSYYFGVDAVLVSKSSAPLSAVVSRASAGSLEVMDNIYRTTRLQKLLKRARESDWSIVGTGTGLPRTKAATVSLSEFRLNKPTLLVLGNEGSGIRPAILSIVTALVSIPSSNAQRQAFMDSVNVGVAGGILLHQLLSAFPSVPAQTTSLLDGFSELRAVRQQHDEEEEEDD